MGLDTDRGEPDVRLDLPPVIKHNWKSKPHRNAWDDRLGGFESEFDRAMEAALVDEEHPRSAVVRTLETENALDLVSRIDSDIEVARQTKNRQTTVALVNEGCPVGANAVLEAEVDPVTAQTVRGVPECCVEQYDEFREDDQSDPIAGIARNTPSTIERGGELVVEDPHPILNLSWSYMGWRFIDFYPCSFECDMARRVATETGRLLRDLGHGERAEAMFEFLSAPAYWSGYHGLAHVKNGWCIGEYTTDDYWQEQVVRFNGYHEELAENPL